MSERAAKKLNVTDHAVLRYLERVKGMDITAIRASLITNELKAHVAVLGGTGSFPGLNGSKLILQDSTVITVIK